MHAHGLLQQNSEILNFAPSPFRSTLLISASDSEADKYALAVVDFISKQPGKLGRLTALGSQVKKPDGVGKLGAFLKSRPNMFKVDDKSGEVTLVAK